MPASLLILSLLALLCTSCTQSEKNKTADLNRIYGAAAQSDSTEINPVIVIPGILGSKLIDPVTQKSIWGIYDGQFVDLSKPENLPLIALPLHGSSREVRGIPNGALSTLRFRALGVPLQQQAYAGILSTLGVGGYLDQEMGSKEVDWGKRHFTCFQFSYDWRLSNATNAKNLHRFIQEKKRYIQEQSRKIHGKERRNIKFDIVAHSMGGLLARYYLRHGPQDLPRDGSLPRLNWAGAKNIDQLIMVGTPNSGSLLAFNDLCHGQNFIPDWQRRLLSVNLPKFPPAILATFPSMFELMPRTRHEPVLNLADDHPLDLYDSALWEQAQWGILNPSQNDILPNLIPHISPEERTALVKAHLRQRLHKAHQFQRSLDRPATPPSHLRISLIAGDAINTPRQIKLDPISGKKIDNDYTPGDSAVLRSSALADENPANHPSKGIRLNSPIKFHKVTFLPEQHLDLTTSPTFTNNLLYQLLIEPKK